MQISANGQMNVEFDVTAIESEIAALKALLVIELGPAYVDAVIRVTGGDQTGTRYNVRFPVRGPCMFDLLEVRDWLHSANLVARNIEGQLVPLGQNGPNPYGIL